jgi:uncharacterized protein (DUF1330 family)
MAAYVIAEIDITDPKAYEEYRAKVPGVIAKYGGKFIVRGGKVEPLEGGWQPKRLAVIEFASMKQALEFHRSEDYAPLMKLRQRASRGKVLIVEGI